MLLPPADDNLDHVSVAWAQASGGILTAREVATTVGRAYLRAAPRAFVQRASTAVWRRRRSRGRIAFHWAPTPSSPLALAAEEACRHALSESMVNHSFRTWAFGRALAEVDGVNLDEELFYAAALLHDLGLGAPAYRRCFTIAGAEKLIEIAARNAIDPCLIGSAADGIIRHITPALTLDEGGATGFYLQAGSMLDLGGLRAADLPRDFVYEISAAAWPLLDIKREVGARWRAESALVRGGRAQVLQRWVRFSTLPRFTPLPPPPERPI